MADQMKAKPGTRRIWSSALGVVAALARDWRADYRWRRAGSAQWSVSSVVLLVGLLLLVWCLR